MYLPKGCFWAVKHKPSGSVTSILNFLKRESIGELERLVGEPWSVLKKKGYAVIKVRIEELK